MDLLPLLLAALPEMLNTAAVIGITALALGFVIFVHELGHFAVAKMCGVRCDKFFVGFDIGGYKISKQIGETEYGIGALPLGGYVKMFGQDDNVANLAEQLEQSKQLEGSPDAKQITGPSGDKIWVDKRSYLAKSVPQRMAIISAGVIMNVIFAFIFAWIAYGVGVPETPAVVGHATPGGAAWEAGLRTGDRIVELDGKENPTYRQLSQSVILSDLEAGLPMKVARVNGGVEELVVKPHIVGPAPMIQVGSSPKPQIVSKGDTTRDHTPAAGADFKSGDKIVAVNGESVESYADLARLLHKYKAEPVTYTLQRGKGETVETTVAANPAERLGVVLTLGPIVSIQVDSPAEAAGLKPGDQIVAINATPVAGYADQETAASETLDPLQIDDRLIGAETATLTVIREGETSASEVEVEPRVVGWDAIPLGPSPLGIESLGAACELKLSIATIVPGSPAAEAELAPGDVLQSVVITEVDAETGEKDTSKIDLSDRMSSWLTALWKMQDGGPDMSVELEVAPSDGETRTVTLRPESVDDQFWTPRGVELAPLRETRRTDSLAERTQLAWNETTSQLSGIFRLLQKLGGQVSVKALGGPVMIAQVTGKSAFEGWGPLLMTLTMFSANLAVLNFLPIPVLDGGHMVFLAYEGLTGRPPNERIHVALHVVGLVFLLGLMAMVFTLDISRLLGVQL